METLSPESYGPHDPRTFELDRSYYGPPIGSLGDVRDAQRAMDADRVRRFVAPVMAAVVEADSAAVEPWVVRGLGRAATGLGGGTEGVILELFYGAGVRENSVPPLRQDSRPIGGFALAA